MNERIKERIQSLEVGQSCEFTANNFAQIEQPRPNMIFKEDRSSIFSSVGEVIAEPAYSALTPTYLLQEQRALEDLSKMVFAAEREVVDAEADRDREKRVHHVAVTTRRVFDRNMAEPAHGVFSRLSLIVYRSR